MSSDIVLTSALRTNLLSLQNTQSLIDQTQERLSTGLKVNSALDNPQSFFAAQGLDNRASDLSRLLDGIGQAISTIQAADDGITSLTKLIEQADSLATSALEATSSAAEGTSIVGDVDVSEYDVTDDATLTFNFTDQNGESVVTVPANGQVALTTGESIDTVINNINALEDADGNKIVSASLTDSGRLQISTLQGLNARIELDTSDTLGATQTLTGQLGFSSILGAEAALTPTDSTSTSVAVNLEASASISSQALYDTNDTTKVADRSTLLTDLVRDANGDGTIGDVAFAIVGTSDDTLTINVGINGGSAAAIAVSSSSTIQSLVDSINDNVSINSRIEASFDETTGRITIAALDGGVESVQLSTTASDGGDNNAPNVQDNARIQANFGFGSGGNLDSAVDDDTVDTVGINSDVENIRFGSGGGEIAQAQADFNKVRAQIDALVADSGYRGVNLLNGDNLITTFNEDRTNQLTTEGTTLTASGLGIDEAAFATRAAIDTALTQVRAALTTVRDFGGSIANDLAIIQTREDFTKNTISNLQEGRDKLTVADANEEGANLLALQTRQALGTTALSLASQSAQSVLRLF